MNALKVVSRFTIQESQQDAFKKLSKECIAIVKEKDQGTLQYDWFLNKDEHTCVVLETFKDSDAVLAHIENLGDTFGEILAISEFSAEIFGDPSKKLADAIAGMETKQYSYYSGI